MSDALLTDFDLHLFAEGTHYRTYEKFGAQVTTIDGRRGTNFAVWAPNAAHLRHTNRGSWKSLSVTASGDERSRK